MCRFFWVKAQSVLLLNFTKSYSLHYRSAWHWPHWHTGQQRSSSTPVCLWPASGRCPSYGSCSSFLLPQFFTRLSSVNHASTFPPGSSGLQLWWWSWHPCAARAQSSSIASWWWWSLYPLAGTVLRGHGWRWLSAKRCNGFSWGLLRERTTAWQGHALSSTSTLIHTEDTDHTVSWISQCPLDAWPQRAMCWQVTTPCVQCR